MVQPNALKSLENTKKAIDEINENLLPVVERLRDGSFGKATAQAQATVALSIGMLKYVGARLQGLDKGRAPDDPLRKELNEIRKVLAEIKAQSPPDADSQKQ